MATAKKVWKGEATIRATNAYSGSDSDLAGDAAYDYSGDINLETSGYEGAIIYLEHTRTGSTDDLTLGIFPSVDGTDRSNNPIFTIEYAGGGDTQEAGIVIRDLQHFEVGVKSGSNDTYDYRIRWDAWRWDVS